MSTTRITRRATLAGGLAASAWLATRPFPAFGQGGDLVSAPLRAIMDLPTYRGGRWGLFATDLASGAVVARLAPTTQFLTASTAKVFSVTTALAVLGGNYRFQTPIVRTAEIASDGDLAGDLILIASGDLTMGGRTKPDGTVDFADFDHYDANALPLATLTPEDPLAGLNDLARQIARQVKGVRNVLIDDRLWDPVEVGDVPITPIVINDNLIDLTVTPGMVGAVATIDWRPRTAAFTVESRVATVATGGDLSIDINGVPAGAGVTRIVVSGTIPAGRAPLVQVFQVPDPAAFARTLLVEALARQGVRVDAPALGPNLTSQLPPRATVVGLPVQAGIISPPYSEYAKLINKVSHNLGANMAPLLVGLQYGKRTFADGMAIEREHVRSAGIDPAQFTLIDGQGLFGNRVSPSAIVQYLRYLTSQPYFADFYASTPSLGVDGSLAGLLPPGDPATGNVHAKTGTLVGLGPDGLVLQTKALAGYISTASGRQLAFSIFLNDLPIAKVDDVLAANTTLGQMAAILYREQ